jgi:outer membrane autotransporter protein
MRVGLSARALFFVAAAWTPLPGVAVAQVQINQNFISQGPAPNFGPLDTVGSGDDAGGNKGTVTGAVQAILIHETLGRDTMFVGATNGGIWGTTDGGNTWTPLTDNAHSLSIGSLDLDVTDPTGKTLIAGIGVTSAGNWAPINEVARPTGVLYSTDGGAKWAPLGLEDLGTQSVIGVAARGDTILAATFEPKDPSLLNSPDGSSYGLYRSTDGGASFNLINSPEILNRPIPTGPITSLVAAPDDPKTFYVAVTSFNDSTKLWEQGVYETKDAGESWQKLFDANTPLAGGGQNILLPSKEQQVLKLAAGKNGSVAISVIQNGGLKAQPLGALYLREETGGDWSSLGLPTQGKPGSGAEISDANPSGVLHSAVAIDPQDTSIVYWAGWEQPGEPTTTGAYRIQGQQLTALTCSPPDRPSPPCSGSIGSPHADPRAFAFDAEGNLLMVGDGGVYKRTNPQDNGVWSGFNTLTVHEPFQVGYGANARRLVVDAQDTGVGVQNVPGGTRYRSVQGADGHAAVVSDKTFPNQSVYYTSEQTLSNFERLVLDADGKSPEGTTPNPGGVPITCSLGNLFEDCSLETGIPPGESAEVSIMLNAVNPKLIALTSGFNIYLAEDKAEISATNIDLALTDLGYGKATPPSTPSFRALAYGTHDNPYVLLAGGEGPNGLYVSTYANPADSAASVPLTQIKTYDGESPTSIAFGPSSHAFYVADTFNLWNTVDQGAHFKPSALPTNFRPTSAEFINQNGVQALLVGGLKTAESQSPIAVADSNNTGELRAFRPFGSGLPNALVYDMSYNGVADVLAVASVGRGVWTLYDVTSYFRQAEVLQFGLPDNDSQPDATYLTDGTQLDGTPFVRPLSKYGTGTLTIAEDATYTGGTNIFGGIVQLGTGGTSGSILGDVSFCSDTIDPLNGLMRCNQGIDKFLVFDRSDTYRFDGAISGPGQLVQNGSGTTILTGASTYTGPTWVNQGALIVNGSITSSVAVNFGGLLGGSGSVGATTVGYGSILAPGNSIGTLTVNGNLTLDPGALYEVEANAQGQSDKVVVKGTVNLTGATLRILAAPGAYKPKTDYVIIDNDGSDAVNGTFGQVTNTLAFLAPSIIYDGGTGNDVVLTLINTTFDLCSVAQTRNQCNVADAISEFPLDDPLYLAVISQTEQGARQAFDALSGELHATVGGTLANDSRYVRDAILGRLMQASSTDSDAQMAALAAAGPQAASINANAMALGYDDKSLSAPPVRSPLAFWTHAFGAWADFDSDGNAATADRNLGGFVSGMDANIGGSWRVGLATGASFSNVDVNARYSSAQVESYHLGGYLGGMASIFALRGGGMWAWSNIDTSRAAVFPGFFERQKASYDADTGQLFGEVAYPTQMWGMALEPFAGLAYVSVDADNFRERGGALASLRGRGTDENVGYTTVGLRAAQTMHWQSMVVTPHVSAAWQHAFDDVTPKTALAFSSTGIGFTVYGVPLAEDSALIDTGLDFTLGPRTTAGVSYSGQFGDRVQDNAVRGRLTWLF